MNESLGREALTAPHPAHIPHDATFTGTVSSINKALRWVGWADQPSSGHHGNPPSPRLRRAGITSVQEVIPGGMNITSAFTYDYENRLTAYGVGGTNFSVEHTYDGYNRLVKTDATIGANTQNFEHVYAGKQHLGNIETTGQPVVGKVWSWEAGAGMPNAGPIESPQRYTASATQFYMVSDERNVERKSYRVASVTAGDYNDDSRYAEWQQVNGNVTPTRPALMAYKSELFNAYQVTLDADRASSAATNHALQLAASDLEYEGTRVKSPVLGRDLNPMGRGDGAYYADGGNAHGGSVAVGRAKPALVGNITGGYGSSVNNGSDQQSPPANCFSACICAPPCFLKWNEQGKIGKPTNCCDSASQKDMMFCCLGKHDREDPVKREWFIRECLGCNGDDGGGGEKTCCKRIGTTNWLDYYWSYLPPECKNLGETVQCKYHVYWNYSIYLPVNVTEGSCESHGYENMNDKNGYALRCETTDTRPCCVLGRGSTVEYIVRQTAKNYGWPEWRISNYWAGCKETLTTLP